MFTDLFDLFIFHSLRYIMLSIEGGHSLWSTGGSVRDDVRAQSTGPSGRDLRNVLCSC